MSALRSWWRDHRERRRQKAAHRPDVGEQLRGARGRNDRDPGGFHGAGDGMNSGGA